MTQPGEPKITFTGPVEITGDVAASKHVYSLFDEDQVRILAERLAECRDVLARQGEGWTPEPRELPQTLSLARHTRCVGRDHELAELAEALRERRNVEVHGPAEIGKTALLRHAAAVGVLAAATVPECRGVLWPRTCTTLADTVEEIVRACYRIQPNVPLRMATATRLLNDARALVVLDGLELPPIELQTLLRWMPDSVVVVASQERVLPEARSLPLGRLPWDVSRALLERELGEPLTDEESRLAEQVWDTWDGNPGQLVRLAAYMREATVQGRTPRLPGEDELPLIVPRLISWLSPPARSTFDTLAAFGNTEWGTQLLTSVTGVPEQRGIAKLLHTRLATGHEGRCRLAPNIAGGTKPDLIELATRIAAWAGDHARPDQVAAETKVIEQTLRACLDAGRHAAALDLAHAASRKLMMSLHWGAWGRVATLGLRAATLTGSLRDEAYFRYMLTARQIPEGMPQQAIEMLIAAIDSDGPGQPKARRLSAEVQKATDSPMSSATNVVAPLTPAARLVDTVQKVLREVHHGAVTVLMRTPGLPKAIQAVQDNPIIKLVGLATLATAGIVAFTAASAPPGHQALGQTNSPSSSQPAPPPPGAPGTTSQPGSPPGTTAGTPEPGAPEGGTSPPSSPPTTTGTTTGGVAAPVGSTGTKSERNNITGVAPVDPRNPCADERPIRIVWTPPNQNPPPVGGPAETVPRPGSFPIRIDATQLVYRAFLIPNVTPRFVNSRMVQTLHLTPGVYGFQVASGRFTDFAFRVTQAGHVDYDARFEHFVTGQNSGTLTLGGLQVTLDARNLSGSGVLLSQMPMTYADWIAHKQIRMLPSKGYQVQQGGGFVVQMSFDLGLDGRMTYAASFDVANGGFLRGNGSTTLEFIGYPICVDARAAGGSGVVIHHIWGMPFNRSRLQHAILLPIARFTLQVGSALAPLNFSLAPNGEFSIPSTQTSYLRLDKVNGLTVLTVLKPPP